MRDTFILEDAGGNEVAKIQEKKLSVRDKMTIERRGDDGDGARRRWSASATTSHIEVDGGEDLKAHGNIVDHEYEIERDGDNVAEVSKKWFRVRDTYGVEIETTARTCPHPGDHGLRRRGSRPAEVAPLLLEEAALGGVALSSMARS